MSSAFKKEDIFGFLATTKLLQIAGYDARLNGAAMRTLMIVCGYANQDGVCYPSLSKIARSLNISQPAVSKQIKILKDFGYLNVQERYSKEKGRRSNVYQLNHALAITYQKEPDIFSPQNITTVVRWLITLLSYMGGNYLEFEAYLTSQGYIKKPLLKNDYKKKVNKKVGVLINKTKLEANAWEQEKNRYQEAGVSVSSVNQIDALYVSLRGFKGTHKMTEFSLQVQKKILGMPLDEAVKYQTKLYQDELNKLS